MVGLHPSWDAAQPIHADCISLKRTARTENGGKWLMIGKIGDTEGCKLQLICMTPAFFFGSALAVLSF